MMASAGKKLLFVIRRSTFTGDEGRGCREFKQAKYPFKWRKYMCARCGALRTEHRAGKAKPDDTTVIRAEEEEHLPPRKRFMLRFERLHALDVAASKEQEKEEEEMEEGEIIWSADAMMVTKGKRAPRRKRADAP